MSEFVLKARPEAKDLFESFAAEHPEQSEIEVSMGADGTTLVMLIIENTPMIATSLALLIGAINGRGIKVKATRDGVEVDIGEIAKPT
jgi:hypothetical protein